MLLICVVYADFSRGFDPLVRYEKTVLSSVSIFVLVSELELLTGLQPSSLGLTTSGMYRGVSRIFERGVQYLLVPKESHQILKRGGSNLIGGGGPVH